MAKSMSFYIILITLVARLELDDPLDAVAVHGGGGIVGLLCVPWFMYAGQAEGERGIFWDGHTSFPWLVLGHNIAGAVAIMAWAGTQSTLLFGGLKMLGILRVSCLLLEWKQSKGLSIYYIISFNKQGSFQMK